MSEIASSCHQTLIGPMKDRSASGPGCVKTCASGEVAELFSPFPSIGDRCQSCSSPMERNREKASMRGSDAGVFTQPGSTTVLTAPERRFRSTPMNGHHQVGPVGPVRANIRSREAKRPAVVPEAFWSEFGNSRRRIALLLPAKQKRGTKEGFVYCRCERPVPPRALDRSRIVPVFRHRHARSARAS